MEYKGMTLVTVRGAGHLVPLNKPSEALTLIHSFLSAEPLPIQRWIIQYYFDMELLDIEACLLNNTQSSSLSTHKPFTCLMSYVQFLIFFH